MPAELLRFSLNDLAVSLEGYPTKNQREEYVCSLKDMLFQNKDKELGDDESNRPQATLRI